MRLIDEISRDDLRKLNLEKLYATLVRVSNWYENKYQKEMTREDFIRIDEEDFLCVRTIGYATLDKIKWFQSYLKGETGESYEKRMEEIIASGELSKLRNQLETHKRIESKLRIKIANLEEENSNLRRENKKLARVEKKISEWKKTLEML